MSTSSMYLWSRVRSAGIMTLPPTMRGLLDAAFFSHQRLLSSITRVPRRNVMEVPGQRWQAARKVASATSWSSTPATCSTMLSPSGVHVSTRKVK